MGVKMTSMDLLNISTSWNTIIWTQKIKLSCFIVNGMIQLEAQKYTRHMVLLRFKWTEGTKSIMLHVVRQVYYVPYPSFVPRKRGCCVVIKTKPIGHIETDDLVDDFAHQVDEVEQINDVIADEQTTSLFDTMVEGHLVDSSILLVDNN